MKLSLIKHIAIFVAAMMISGSCSDVLVEQPRSLTPDYFKTAQGLNSGITAAYATFRPFYGSEGGKNITVYGTDEFTHGQQVTNPPFSVYNTALNPGTGDPGSIWGRAYPAINTCNGIIELGVTATGLTDAARSVLIAEAKFIRAAWYYLLVTQFGAVTLDLGSGPLKFNQSIDNFASRATLAECYDAIIKDLVDITDGQNNDDLPDTRPASTSAGHAWKASALHLLAKVYLTRGWSSAAQSTDFQKSYDAALQLINNRATYGVSLLPDYASVHAEGNEYNAETLFLVNWNDNTTYNNYTGFGGPSYQNASNFLFGMRYDDNLTGLVRDVANGRPFVRYKPTSWLLNTAFADKVNDSRYDKSFKTVWYVNSTSTRNPKNLPLGDTAVWMVPAHRAAAVLPTINSRRYLVFLPTAATNPATYYGPSGAGYPDYKGYDVQNRYFPTLRKYLFTGARPNNDVAITSVRPFIVYRFAETYLIAAEAALKGASGPMSAVQLINVVRTRAAANASAVAAMTANTATDLASGGIDYILDERSRELAGEQMRWMDLVRTGRLIARVNLYNNAPATTGALTPSPQAFHILRPIPQTQIDASRDNTTADHKYPQNPGY